MSAQVEDPSKYGVVVTDDTGKVDRFVEKPKVRDSGFSRLSPQPAIRPIPDTDDLPIGKHVACRVHLLFFHTLYGLMSDDLALEVYGQSCR